MFDAKAVQGAIDALAEGDGAKALEILKALLTAAATGGAAPPPSDGPVAENAEPTPEQKEYAALARSLMSLSNTSTVGAVETWVKELAAARVALDADRAALESSERVSLVTKLVALKAETPATAWARDAAGNLPADGAARLPCKRLAAESLESLRERVAALSPTVPVTPNPRVPVTPVVEDGQIVKTARGEVQLSASEVRNCQSAGAKLEDYALNKMARESARKR